MTQSDKTDAGPAPGSRAGDAGGLASTGETNLTRRPGWRTTVPPWEGDWMRGASWRAAGVAGSSGSRRRLLERMGYSQRQAQVQYVSR